MQVLPKPVVLSLSSAIAGRRWVKIPEVFYLVSDSEARICLALLQVLQHLLVVGHFALLTDPLVHLNRLVEMFQEGLKAFNVLLHGLQLSLAILRLVLFFLFRLIRIVSPRLRGPRTPDKVYLIAVLVRLVGDFLPQTLDRHLDDTVLTRGLEALLCLLIIANHEQCFFGLNRLQRGLLLCNLVRVIQRLLPSILFVSVGVLHNRLHILTTPNVIIFEVLISIGKTLVSRYNILNVREVIRVLLLNLTQEILELLQLLHFIFNSRMLLIEDF